MNDPLAGNGRHVVLVEDHWLLRRIVEQSLVTAGYRVTVVEGSEQAVALFESGATADLLLTDIRMPGRLTGLDLAEWARARRPAMAILLQTAYEDVDAGAFPVLHKPYDPDALLGAIRDVLSSRAWHGNIATQ